MIENFKEFKFPKERSMIEISTQPYLKGFKSVERIIRSLKTTFIQEHVILLIFDTSNKLLFKDVIFKGGLNCSIVDPKVIFNTIFKFDKACSFILAHNHTSESVNPSPEDFEITNSLKKGSEYLDLIFFDHIIFNESKILSMKKEKLF